MKYTPNFRSGNSLTTSRKVRSKLGSSLILVLLVVAGIITIVFGAQRVTLVQFNQSSREEDNLSAYYAAKAGIEDGLVRYRFERNSETQSGNVYRYNLTGGVAIGEVPTTEVITSANDYRPSNQYYDLTLDYKTDRLNIATNGNPVFSEGWQLAKDDALELTGFPPEINSPPYYLRLAFKFVNNDGSDCTDPNVAKAFVQVQQQKEDGTITQFEALRPTNNVFDTTVGGASFDNILISGGSLVTSIRLRPFYCSVQYAFATSDTDTGKGIGVNAGPEFDSLSADITAVGYFGSAKRTLVATVNRNTGRLISVYDFNALAGRNVKQP